MPSSIQATAVPESCFKDTDVVEKSKEGESRTVEGRSCTDVPSASLSAKEPQAAEEEASGLTMRPSITTGAGQQWAGRHTPVFGQPRPIQAYTSAMPTIFISGASNSLPMSMPAAGAQGMKLEPVTAVEHSALTNPSFQYPFAGMDSPRTAKQEQTESQGGAVPCSSAEVSDRGYAEGADRGYAEQGLLRQKQYSLPHAANSGRTVTTMHGGQRCLTQLDSSTSGNNWVSERPNHVISMDLVPSITVTTAPGTVFGSCDEDADSAHDDPAYSGGREGLRSASRRGVGGKLGVSSNAVNRRSKPLICELDPDAPGLSEEQRRRIRRRINNRESARRVREKRDADMLEVTAKVAVLEADQTRLISHCTSMERCCKNLSEDLTEMRTKWEATRQENMHLNHELEYLQLNMQAPAMQHFRVNSSSAGSDIFAQENSDLMASTDFQASMFFTEDF